MRRQWRDRFEAGTTPLPAAGLWTIAALSVGVPAAWAGWSIVRGVTGPDGWKLATESAGLTGGAWARLGTTLGVAGLIGLMSAALGLGPAWLLARGGRRAWVWLIVLVGPLLMPASLAYAGWGVLRAPLTPGATWLEDASRTWWPEAPFWAGRIIGVLGLVLWSWPLAMLAAIPGLRRIQSATLESLRIGVPGWRGLWTRVRLALGPGLCGGAVVALVMLGSAVPLHLAQIETDAIRLWRLLDQTASGARWSAWAGAWPSVMLATIGGIVLGRWATRPTLAGSGGTWRPGVRRTRWVAVWSVGLWCLSVATPFLLLILSVREPNEFGRFWARHGHAATDSAALGACVALAGGMMVLATAYLTGGQSQQRPALGVGILFTALFVGALAPGVLVGSTTLSAWTAVADATGWDWVVQSGSVVVLAHLCRFGSLAMLVGLWIARSESPALSTRRNVEGLIGLWAWLRAIGPGAWSGACGGAIAIGLLSLYEIESAVIVQPAGIESLSRHLLSLLHFARDEELSVALAWLVGLGLLPATLSAACVAGGLVRGQSADRGHLNGDFGTVHQPARRVER